MYSNNVSSYFQLTEHFNICYLKNLQNKHIKYTKKFISIFFLLLRLQMFDVAKQIIQLYTDFGTKVELCK